MRHVTYKELPASRRFGVELELSPNLSKELIADNLKDYEACHDKCKEVTATYGKEGWAQSIQNDYWHVKFDRTCGPLGKDFDHGWEVASYIGAGPSDIYHISRAARWLAASGSQTNLNCGLHIHVETKDFDTCQMGTMLARWLKVEDKLIKFCHESRWNNEHCQPLRKRAKKKKAEWVKKNPDFFWNQIQPLNLSSHNNKDKRFTLNTVGFAIAQGFSGYSRNTVELRLPECSLDEIHVRNWTRLIIAFVEAAKNATDPPDDIEPVSTLEELLYYLGVQGISEFVVPDEELLGLKVWILKKLAASNMSPLAQDAAKQLEFISRF